ncbi:MAG: MlaD family protein [Rhodospirillales bacterium]|nr:MlaD family protein [Rhodospirillales bacterium]
MNATYSKDETHSIKIGLYTILIIALLASCYIIKHKLEQNDEERSHYAVLARFGRTDGLAVGNPVRMAGLDIGKVINARIDRHYKAILTFEIKDNVKIPDDSSASIVSDGILGTKYIEIEPGGSEDYIAPGGEFTYTQDAMVLEELLDRIIGIGKANRNKNSSKDKEQNNE